MAFVGATSASRVYRHASIAVSMCAGEGRRSAESVTSRRALLRLATASVVIAGLKAANCHAEEPGLEIEDLVVGTGAQPSKGDGVEAHYTGWLGGFEQKQFDSSQRRGPLRFTVGVGQVIKGWDEAILSMKEGGRRRIVVPPNLGYGSRGAGRVIPPNSTLYFEIELLRVFPQ